jgi:uncharacterized protein YuzE
VRIEYDKETDSLTITLREARIRESDEVRPGVIADFGYDGGVVGFEVLGASKVAGQIREVVLDGLESASAGKLRRDESASAPLALHDKPKKYGGK